MNKRRRVYLKLNIMSLVFLAVSFISVTLAWFIYSGLSTVKTEVNVKAWYIEIEKDGEKVSNDIVISLDEIYPGMETVTETVKLKNLGDSNAQVKYKIESARILGNEEDNFDVNNQDITPEELEDKLSHDYPFHINTSLSKNFVLAKTDESTFDISISWPLDSGYDELDSYWGTEAYKFKQNENELLQNNADYQVRPSIQIVISLTAEQYLEIPESSDINYPLGKEILFDVINQQVCTQISSTCIKTNVIDVNNKLSDETVTLIPNILSMEQYSTFDDYDTSYSSVVENWNVQNRTLLASDILKVISTDVYNSKVIKTGLSDSIIGTLKYGNRVDTKLSTISDLDGYYIFNSFEYLDSSICYWTNTEYNDENGIAIITGSDVSKLYGKNKSTSCKIVPVIIASKSNIEQ